MIDHILPVLLIKHAVNQDGGPDMPQKLTTGMVISVSKPSVLLCPRVLWKETTNVDTKVLGMRHHSYKDFCGIFVGIPQHQKWNPHLHT